MSSQSPEVWTVIPNLNGAAVLPRCGAALVNQTHSTRVVVIDNASTDSSVLLLREMFPTFEVLVNDRNYGYVGAVNRGIQRALRAGADWILLLNSDAFIDSNYVRTLLEAASLHRDVGALSGTILNAATDRIEYQGGTINWNRGTTVAWKRDRGASPFQVQWAPGVALMVKADIFSQIGLLDPVFFAYWEETDFLMRMRSTRQRILVVPTALAKHVGQATSKRLPGIVPYYAYARNRIIFMKRWAPRWKRPVFVATMLLITIPGQTAYLAVTSGGWSAPTKFLQGIFAGLRELVGSSN